MKALSGHGVYRSLSCDWSILTDAFIHLQLRFCICVAFSIFLFLPSANGRPQCTCVQSNGTSSSSSNHVGMICASVSCAEECSFRHSSDEGKTGALRCRDGNGTSVTTQSINEGGDGSGVINDSGGVESFLFLSAVATGHDCRCLRLFLFLNVTENLTAILLRVEGLVGVGMTENGANHPTSPFEDSDFKEFRDSLNLLNLSNNAINHISWKALSVFRSLEHLDLSKNLIATLEDCIDCRFTVRILDISVNRLTRLPISKNSGAKFDDLNILNVSGNEIRTLDFVGENLREFWMSENQVSAIETGVFTSVNSHLEVIDLSRNKIFSVKNFTFVDLSSVRLINLSRNSIANIETAAFHSSDANSVSETETVHRIQGNDLPNTCLGRTWTALDTLDLSHNKLRSIDDAVFMGPLCGVRTLLLGNNRILRLSRYIVEQLRWLEVLELQHNELTWLEVGSFTSTTLRHIDLSHNDLRKIISMTFLYLPVVTYIDLSYNDIGYLYRYAFYRICKDSNQRIRISFRGNRLQTDAVWKMLCLLQHQENSTCVVDADLRDNQVTHLMGIEAIQALKAQISAGDASHFGFWERLTIDVSGNPVECDCQLTDELALVSYVLESFNASSSANSSADMSAWTKLNCSQPPVFQGFSVAEFLAYSICPLQISYTSCPVACDCRFDIRGRGNRHLNCSGRHLSMFPRFESPYFNALDLSYNELTEVPASYFRSSDHVVYLDLSHNHLKSLPSDALQRMSSLRQLFLHQNELKYLPPEIEQLPQLKYLSIQGNPLACDCSHSALRLVATKLRHVVSDFPRVRCADGRLLWRLNLTNASPGCSLPAPSIAAAAAAEMVAASVRLHQGLLALGSVAVVVFFAAAVLTRLRSKRTFSRPRGSWKKIENQEDLLRYDVFVSYCDLDEAWVTGTLLDIIWSESGQYSVSLQQQQQPQQQPQSSVRLPSDNIRRNIDSSKVTIVVLSKRFLKTIWATDSYRTMLLEKLESERHQFIFVYLERVDIEELDRDLHGFLPEEKTLKVTDPLFAEKLVYHLPPPLRISGPSSYSDPASGLLVELTDGVRSESKSNREKY